MTVAMLIVAASADAQNANAEAHIAAARAVAGKHAGMVLTVAHECALAALATLE